MLIFKCLIGRCKYFAKAQNAWMAVFIWTIYVWITACAFLPDLQYTPNWMVISNVSLISSPKYCSFAWYLYRFLCVACKNKKSINSCIAHFDIHSPRNRRSPRTKLLELLRLQRLAKTLPLEHDAFCFHLLN